MQHEQALVGLGANLGDAAATLRAALLELDALQGCSLLRVSGLWRSAPVDAGGPDYCNAVAELRCEHGAEELLRRMQHIESRHGRVRPQGVRNAPRTLDLDLLCFGELRLQLDQLTLPHPRMHERAFVLAPLAEIRPDWRLPDGEAIADALRRLREAGQQVQRIGPLDPRG
jgi:2-amino-4-hydroxy-6-hydroxymethyldihydropteridine diphosphokinase